MTHTNFKKKRFTLHLTLLFIVWR